MITCTDLRKRYPGVECCISCHEEEDMGYTTLQENNNQHYCCVLSLHFHSEFGDKAFDMVSLEDINE